MGSGPRLSPSGYKRLAEAEQEARGDRVGLWSDPNPVAPWDWRASGRLKGPANKHGK